MLHGVRATALHIVVNWFPTHDMIGMPVHIGRAKGCGGGGVWLHPALLVQLMTSTVTGVCVSMGPEFRA